MNNRYFLVAILILLSGAASAARSAVHFTCDFLENHADSGWQVVDSRAFVAPLQEDFQFSMGNFSYRLHADTVGTKAITLQSMVNCLAEPPRNFLDQKTVLKGASVFFDSVLVRGKSYYRIRLTFDSLANLKSDCDYRFGDSSFVSDPSGKYDFYFIRESLGDYRWNQVRDAFEYDYRRIARVLNLTDQTKINYHISPCEIRDVGWDQRWENAVDLSRNNVFGLLSPSVNQLHMPVVLSVRLMRNWGYAPAFVVEGIASAPEFCDLFAKKALKENRLPRLTDLTTTRKYRSLDRPTASMTAGSFASYLLMTRGLPKLRAWYDRSTDLTVATAFDQVYGASLADIEKEWRSYLDTLTIPAGAFMSHIERAQLFMHVDEMMFIAKTALETTEDTAYFGPILANLYYTLGEYAEAGRFFRYTLDHDSTKVGAAARVYLANMMLAEGKLTAAESLYQQAVEKDTNESFSCHKLAQIALSQGRDSLALELCRKAAKRNSLPANGVDINLVMGDVFLRLGQPDSAGVCFQSAMDNAKLLSAGAGDNPLNYLRFGKAAVRLGSAKVALDYLNVSLFLEERLIYLGQTFLALGQAYDLLGDRKAALENYHKVLKYKTSYLDRQEVQKYLQRAYHN